MRKKSSYLIFKSIGLNSLKNKKSTKIKVNSSKNFKISLLDSNPFKTHPEHHINSKKKSKDSFNHRTANPISWKYSGWIISWNSTLIVLMHIVYRKREWKWINQVSKMKTTVDLKWKSVKMIKMTNINTTMINSSKNYDFALFHSI